MKKVTIQERGNNNYLSLMPHRSMYKSLKFPREPCWTKMRSLGWLSIKMSLIQPWKGVMGFKHWELVKLSGHPVGKREETIILECSSISAGISWCKNSETNYSKCFYSLCYTAFCVINPSARKKEKKREVKKESIQPLEISEYEVSCVLIKIKMCFFFCCL